MGLGPGSGTCPQPRNRGERRNGREIAETTRTISDTVEITRGMTLRGLGSCGKTTGHERARAPIFKHERRASAPNRAEGALSEPFRDKH